MYKKILGARYENGNDTIREVPSNRCMIYFTHGVYDNKKGGMLSGDIFSARFDMDAGTLPHRKIINEAYGEFIKTGSQDKELLAHFISRAFVKIYLDTIKLVKGEGFRQTFFTEELLNWKTDNALKVHRGWAILSIDTVRIELILSEDDTPIYVISNYELVNGWVIQEKRLADLNKFSEDEMYNLLIDKVIKYKLL